MSSPLLNFEHTIELNRIRQTAMLSADLWRGLVARVFEPERFLLALESSNIVRFADNQYQRTLHFAHHRVTDRATLFPQSKIEIVSIDKVFPAFSSSAHIIAEGASLAVRFCYERVLGDGDDEQVVAHLKLAYRQMDEHALDLIEHDFKENS